MINEKLTFRMAKNGSSISFEEDDSFAQKFCHGLGLKVSSGCWSEIRLDSPRIVEFIERSKLLIDKDEGRFDGLCLYEQEIIEDNNTNIEWYELISNENFDTDEEDGILTCKADRMLPNINIASGFFYNQFVSERFKNIVQMYDLKGIEFIWIKDKGKYNANQWYLPLTTNALGRGIDHPWFDTDTLGGSDTFQPIDSFWRYGVWNFSKEQIKSDVEFDNDIQKQIIGLFNMDILKIVSYKMFLRKYIPNVDFAYIWKQEDKKLKEGISRHRGLCISKRAKDILLSNNIISEDYIKPIMILDELPNGTKMLDGINELPQPYYYDDEIDIIRNKIEIERTKFDNTAKPHKKITNNMVVNLFKKTIKLRRNDFCKPAKNIKEHLDTLFLPNNWLDILKISNGGYISGECTIVPIEELREFNAMKQELCERLFDKFPNNLVHIAYSVSGDWYSMELWQKNLKDCRILRISHETCQPDKSWESIAEFIWDMIQDYDE